MEAGPNGELTLLALKLAEAEQNLDHDLVPTQDLLEVEENVLERINKLFLATVMRVPPIAKIGKIYIREKEHLQLLIQVITT